LTPLSTLLSVPGKGLLFFFQRFSYPTARSVSPARSLTKETNFSRFNPCTPRPFVKEDLVPEDCRGIPLSTFLGPSSFSNRNKPRTRTLAAIRAPRLLPLFFSYKRSLQRRSEVQTIENLTFLPPMGRPRVRVVFPSRTTLVSLELESIDPRANAVVDSHSNHNGPSPSHRGFSIP